MHASHDIAPYTSPVHPSYILTRIVIPLPVHRAPQSAEQGVGP
ncbi:hypothetical protein CU044_1567 [Streptomyces sp. L-9-10]|nr:hypothetical protein CU044_1567 [Streptomyces sp. L-9-10]